jgi:hypothetical protein
MECRTDPASPDLEFVPQAGSRTIVFRGKRPDRELGRACVLTLNCTLRGTPSVVDYFIMPQHAGDPPAVWNIRRVYFKYLEGGEQSCTVTATVGSAPAAPRAAAVHPHAQEELTAWTTPARSTSSLPRTATTRRRSSAMPRRRTSATRCRPSRRARCPRSPTA